MINFRYHLVSLTAVFLALAIGLVLGTAALNGPAADGLQNSVNSLTKEKDALREAYDQLQGQLDDEEEFAKQIAPTTLNGKLTDKPVLVVNIAGASDEYVKGAVEMLGYTGTKITGQIGFTDNFTDPDKNNELLSLAKEVLPPNVDPLPNNSNGVETASALLAAVLMAGGPELKPEDVKKVLAGFTEAQMITGKDTLTGVRAVAVLFITGKEAVDTKAAARNKNVVTAAAQFDARGPAVLSSPDIGGSGSPVNVVRNDPALSTKMSTVDNISTPQGQLSASLALATDLAGRVGQYGTAANAQSLVPLPAA